jgi:hypothetical protein
MTQTTSAGAERKGTALADTARTVQQRPSAMAPPGRRADP